MTKCCGFVCNVAVATYRTSISGVTRLGASRIGYYCVVIVTKRGDFFLCKKNIATDSALLTFSKSVVGTSRCLAGHYFYLVVGAKILTTYVTSVILVKIGVSVSRKCGLRNKSFATNGTDLAIGKTGLGTSGCLSIYGKLTVSKSLGFITNIAVATYRTSVGGVTSLGTSRIGYFCAVAMSKLGNLCSISVLCIVLTSKGHSSLLVAGRLNGNNTVIPSVCLGIKFAIFLTANGTYSLLGTGSSATGTFVLTANGTSAIYEVVLSALSKHRNDNVLYTHLNELVTFLNVELVATVTGIELYITGLIIGRSYSGMSLRLIGVVVVILNNLKNRLLENLKLTAGFFNSENNNDVLAYVFSNSVAHVYIVHTVNGNKGTCSRANYSGSVSVGQARRKLYI